MKFFFVVGILEFNPQLAGHDITPANLEFGSMSIRRRERREKSFSDVSAIQSNQPSSFTAVHDELIPLVCKLLKKERKFFS